MINTAEDLVCIASAIERVNAFFAVEFVHPRTAIDDVIAAAAKYKIITCLTEQNVVAGENTALGFGNVSSTANG